MMASSGYKTTGYVADAYSHLLLGRTDDDLFDMEFTKSDIRTAREFLEKYQDRSMFPSNIAREIGISIPLVAKLKKIYREHQNRLDHTE
jgi:hypothetical protein